MLMRADQQLNVKRDPMRVKAGTAGVRLKSDMQISEWIEYTLMIFFSLIFPAFLELVCLVSEQLNSGSSFFSF